MSKPVKNPIIDGHRICYKCGKNLPLSEYHKNSAAKYGLDGKCKECTTQLKAGFLEKNPTYFKDYHQRNKNRRNAQQRFRNYGLTDEQYKHIFIMQGERCAICWSKDHNSRNWHVDHDHQTGKVRGILCHDCNHMLGGARDNPTALARGVQYLQKTEIVNPEWVIS